MSPNAEYQYVGLLASQIRILELDPAQNLDDELILSLHKYSRSNSAPVIWPSRSNPRNSYEAISYAWGDDTREERVTVRQSYSSDPDRDLYLRTTVVTMLRHLRNKFTTRRLWIDTVCIDQKNASEKADQVTRMGETYRDARRTLVWLGPDLRCDGSQKSPRSFFHDLFHLESRSPDGAVIATGHSLISTWPVVQKFLELPWFQRRWVIQEVVLSQNVSMVLGNDVMCFDCIMDSIKHAPIGALTISDAARYAFQVLLAMHRLRAGGPRERFLNLLVEMDAAQCSDDRDRLYALNSLRKAPMWVDYTATPDQVFRWFAIATINEDPELLACGGAAQAGPLPSWTPNWRVPRTPQPLFYLGVPAYRTRDDVRGVLAIDGEVLLVRGTVIGVIASKGPVFGQAWSTQPWQCLQQYLSFYTQNPNSKQTNRETEKYDFLLQLLSARKFKSAQRLHPWIKSDVKQASDNSIEPHSYDLDTYSILTGIYNVMRGRCCFLTDKNDWAVGSADLLPGDSIVTIAECQYPFILRQSLSDASGNLLWTLIGDCCITMSKDVERLARVGPLQYFNIA
ncbi:heterokaryon incompatibility protein-domain-containing protein [Pyrenochaeta sp. MPI-SDFR-AT-0127]|nr:heterokaryon incompatibility protein-domain-containing protein [Pyrenochaeta sp. MPI-SDFR-AT-0127]